MSSPDYSVYYAEKRAGVYGDHDDEQDDCPTCDSAPCQCDEIYDRYSDR